MDLNTRLRHQERLREHYARFDDFLVAVMEGLLGFQCSPIQIDIGKFMSSNEFGDNIMVQAQRSQAKTTIAAAYAVWELIHRPATRVLIVSAGDDLGKEIAGWVIQIIEFMPELAYLRPDHGQRSAVDSYEIHRALRGPEKSPSIACMPITGNLQGRRADLLIADDIESSRNSMTQTMRERLINLTRDFSSICTAGKILYLGTPQSVDSIYNTLPSRGFHIRIWPGRYPTVEQEEHYGPALAPIIADAVKANPKLRKGGGIDGDLGQAVDPIILPEERLCKKESDQGAAYFQLQHMLLTALTDELRFPLKLRKIKWLSLDGRTGPLETYLMAVKEHKIVPPAGCPVQDPMYRVKDTGEEWGPYTDKCHMYIDPAGGGVNADETGWAVSKFLGGTVHVLGCGGVKGGYSDDTLDEIIDIMVRYGVNWCDIEDNYGKGAFLKILQPRMLRRIQVHLEPVWSQGQKELRIIDTLEPVIGAGKLVVNEDIIEEDIQTTQRYAAEKRSTYSLLFQIARLTRDRGCMVHDDRVEALAGTVRHWVPDMDLDERKIVIKAQKDRYKALMNQQISPHMKASGKLVGLNFPGRHKGTGAKMRLINRNRRR